MSECCGPLLEGRIGAPTAERLMRSRYTAFTVLDAEYLLRTWHPDIRPSALDLEDRRRWTGLEILGTTGGGMLHTTGTVEFQRAGVPGNWNGGLRDYVWEMMIAHLDTSVVLLALPSFWKDDGSEVRMRLVMSCT